MNKHRGEIFKLRFEQSGLFQTTFCNSLGISLGTLTNWFNSAHLGWDKLLMAGPIMGWDFSEDFPELKYMKYDSKADMIIVSEPVEAYKSATLDHITKQDEVLKMIVALLEKIINMLEKR